MITKRLLDIKLKTIEKLLNFLVIFYFVVCSIVMFAGLIFLVKEAFE